MSNIYTKTSMLLGNDKTALLKNSKAAVFGLGGVGSFAAEALARSGVGSIILIDKDVIEPSNINRQLYALNGTVGKAKVKVAYERITDINPSCSLIAEQVNVTENNIFELLSGKPDFVIDAIDDVNGKMAIIKACQSLQIAMISSMGTGNKLDVTKLCISDIYKTTVCPLAKAVRKRCRDEGVPSLQCVYSTEIPMVKMPLPASMIFVPAAAGLIAAGQAVAYMTKNDNTSDMDY